MGVGLSLLCGALLVGAVVLAVHHAEVVALRVGEPFGTLVLALSITVIEAALILSVILAGGPSAATLARDTMFATVMVICNGVVGACLFLGGIRHREQSFRIEGAGPAFAALIALATLVLVLPSFTVSAPGQHYTPSQLAFAGISSLILWCVFAFFQTVRHRDFFLPRADRANEAVHVEPPGVARAWTSFGILVVSLAAVIGLAKLLSPVVEQAVRAVGAPPAFVGVVIALIVLAPETTAAIRAALADRLQTSMNLALGSALASIGLTIPVVVAMALALDLPLVLGLDPKDLALLLLTFLVGATSLATGRTNMMQGAVHLVVFAAFLFLALVP
jgi:Ca2+:H+ antiporter